MFTKGVGWSHLDEQLNYSTPEDKILAKIENSEQSSMH